jgi:RNA polymerase sigma-70 factor (ECF subfamily)
LIGGDVGTGGFDRWYACHQPRLLMALALLAGDVDVARDLTAEAFSRAFERWDRVEVMANPAGWTYTVAVNLLHRRRRRRVLEARRLRQLCDWPAIVDGRPEEEIDVIRAILALPERARTAVFLRYYAGMTEAEVAAAMGIAAGTAGATLSVARKRLAALLADYSPIGELPRG